MHHNEPSYAVARNGAAMKSPEQTIARLLYADTLAADITTNLLMRFHACTHRAAKTLDMAGFSSERRRVPDEDKHLYVALLPPTPLIPLLCRFAALFSLALLAVRFLRGG